MAGNESSIRSLPSGNGGNEEKIETLLAHYLGRLNDGERLDRARILAENPELGEEVLRDLEAYLALHQTGEVDNGMGGQPLGILGDYTLRRQIGRGGMGVVYEAWQNSLDRQVALKVLPAGIAADDRAFQRFMREAKTAAKLQHPHVVGVYGMGVEQNTPYFAMEFVEGETLAQALTRLKQVDQEAETVFGRKDCASYFENLAKAFADVADGLQHAHSKHVTHRDIKPSNLILDGEGRLRILDFGLARLEGQESLTASGDFLGTPLYMSPEQARRKKIPIDHRTDIYSFGATLYEMLTLDPPFRGKDHADTLSQIIERDPVEPRKCNPRVPRGLETIVLKCMRKQADDRYGTAEALAQDLRRFVRGDAIEARPQGRLDRVLRRVWVRRLPITLLGLGVATAALLVILFGIWSREAMQRAGRRYNALVAESQRALDLGLAMKAQAAIQEKTTSPAFEWSNPFTRELPEVRLEQELDHAEAQLQEARKLFPSRPEAVLGLERVGKLRLAELSDGMGGEDDALGRGVKLFLAGEQDPARIELAVARGRLPDSPAPVLLLAQSHVLSGQLDAAEAWLERCFQEAPPERQSELAMSIAEFWFTQRQSKRDPAKSSRAERINKWLGRVPDSLRKRQAVFMATAATDPANAVAAGRAALELAPEDPVTHCAFASLYAWDLADFAKAEEHARRALAAEPDDPGVLNTVGQVWWELGRYRQALAAAEGALARRQGNSRSLYVKAIAKTYLGECRESIDILHELLQRYPGDSPILGHLSEALRSCDRHDESLDVALEGVRLAPGSALALLFLGHEYRAQGRLDEAIQAYELALEIDPSNRWALWGYGRACVQLKDFDKALALLAEAVSRAAAVSGASAGSRGDFCMLLRGIPKPKDLRPLDDFIARFERGRPGFEEHPIVLEGLALAYLNAPKKRDLEKALGYAMRAVKASGWGSVEPQVTLASVRFASGEVTEAIRLLEEYVVAISQGVHQDFLQLCRDTLAPDLASFASVDALFRSAEASSDGLSEALEAFEKLEATPGRQAIVEYFRGRLLESRGRCEEATPAFRAALLSSEHSWSTAIPLVGACIEGSEPLRKAVGDACRAALAEPAPSGVLSRSLAALRSLARPGEEIPGLEHVYVWWLLGPFPDRETLLQGALPFQSVDLQRPVLFKGGTLTWRPHLASSFEVDIEKILGSHERSSAFLSIEVEAPSDVDAQVSLEVDDEASFRLNDVEIYRREGVEGPIRDVFGARFHAGPNRMLLEVRNLKGRWGASVRIEDATGSPIPFRQRF
jgi:tetratricopeptide (TPR) repeat protein